MSKTLKTIFFTTAKVVNMAIRCKKSANILIYFKDKINEKYTNETYRVLYVKKLSPLGWLN